MLGDWLLPGNCTLGILVGMQLLLPAVKSPPPKGRSATTLIEVAPVGSPSLQTRKDLTTSSLHALQNRGWCLF